MGKPSPPYELVYEAVRDEYDRQLSELKNIDNKAMRLTRTAVIILGFVASALTVAGPDSPGEVSVVPVAVGAAGVSLVAAALFVSIGTYSVTEYPKLTRRVERNIVGWGSQLEWYLSASMVGNLAIDELDAEVQRNGRYLGFAQLCLAAGVLLLATGSIMVVLAQAYSISARVTAWAVVLLTGAFVLLSFLGGGVRRLIR